MVCRPEQAPRWLAVRLPQCPQRAGEGLLLGAWANASDGRDGGASLQRARSCEHCSPSEKAGRAVTAKGEGRLGGATRERRSGLPWAGFGVGAEHRGSPSQLLQDGTSGGTGPKAALP